MSFINQILINMNNIKLNNSEKKLEAILYKIGNTLAVIIIMYLTIRIGSKIITKFVEKQKKMKYTIDLKKAKTLGAVLKSILRYTVYFFGIVTILTEYLGTISLTFAGIGGVAIGFGAQSLIKDIINGVFILFEDQFAVGDYVEIEEKSGIIENMELRITKIRDLNGDLHIIPNGLIKKVTNHSRGALSFNVSISLSYDENMEKAMGIINQVCTSFIEGNDTLIEEPTIVGITEFKENYYIIKVSGKSKPMTHWKNENNLRMEIKKAFDNEKINMMCPQYEILSEYNVSKENI